MLVLNQIVRNASSNDDGDVLYQAMLRELNNDKKSTIVIDNDAILSSSFLNSSFGRFLDEYGMERFKASFSFQGSSNQFRRLKGYLSRYSETYLTC